MPPIQYEIIDGVRRAKAMSTFGRPTISARVWGRNGVTDVPIDSLLSPHKDEIDTTVPGGSVRYNRILNAISQGKAAQLPPITVRVGNKGIPIRQVRVI